MAPNSIDTEMRSTVCPMLGVSVMQVKTEKDVPATPAPAAQAEVGPVLVGCWAVSGGMHMAATYKFCADATHMAETYTKHFSKIRERLMCKVTEHKNFLKP